MVIGLSQRSVHGIWEPPVAKIIIYNHDATLQHLRELRDAGGYIDAGSPILFKTDPSLESYLESQCRAAKPAA
jgi:hypothetical protein